jgi:hypothetical protein
MLTPSVFSLAVLIFTAVGGGFFSIPDQGETDNGFFLTDWIKEEIEETKEGFRELLDLAGVDTNDTVDVILSLPMLIFDYFLKKGAEIIKNILEWFLTALQNIDNFIDRLTYDIILEGMGEGYSYDSENFDAEEHSEDPIFMSYIVIKMCLYIISLVGLVRLWVLILDILPMI